MGHATEDMTASVDLAEAYRILLENPDASLPEFATCLEIDVAGARWVLDRLASVALVEQRDSGYIPVSPILAMQNLIDREHTHLMERQRALRESYEALAGVLPSYRELGSTPGLGAVGEELTDLPTIRHRLEELAVSATVEVLSFTPPARDPSAARSASRMLDLSVLRRGVRMRTIYMEAMYDDVETRNYAAELTASGGSVRFASDLPLRMVIVDRARAMVPNDPIDGTHGCLLVWHTGIVQALVAMFEAYWRAGRKFGADECSALERVILSRLMDGAKDEAIARHLGLSVRTVRRCVADLMCRLETSSRFALGVIAARRHWI